ncbi:hypothetical protein AMECASPLE_024505 [Ameca splendens]|uniref:Uncharacterized protein n=1 Tax=Ameca splendens TaxID=208324 RepID=A0ABV0YGL2_9TELE
MFQSSAVKVHIVTSGQTFGAHEELLRQMKTRIQLILSNFLESFIIIVFCPITSRVGSDVEAAMNLVPAGDRKVILVLMHHTRDQNYSTAGKEWSETFPNVILDAHVLFHETVPGLLGCAKNVEAVNQIVQVLDQLSQNQQIRHPEHEDQGLLRWRGELPRKCFPYWKIVVAFLVVVFILFLVIILLQRR